MFFSFLSVFLVAAAIPLDGISGRGLSVRASFDANNVRLGDPMSLMVDFFGDADFENLHPPKLSREVDSSEWRIDDASARTDTVSGARRLVYRVRPVKEGLVTFPSLSFAYSSPTGSLDAVIRTSAIPVRVKPGSQAALAFLDEDVASLPMPDGITVAPGREMDEDLLFRWRKACRTLSADAFAEFSFPEARMNEAACRILAGEWAKALDIYSSLEWRIGQTAAIERGIVAALSRKTGAAAELPAWRQILRPLLRHAWRGRLATALAALFAVAAFFFVTGKIAKALAAFALAAAIPSAAIAANDPFEQMEKLMREQEERMEAMMNNLGGSRMGISFNGARQEEVKVVASASIDRNDLEIGSPFEFVVSLEFPKGVAIEGLRFGVTEDFGLVFDGKVGVLPDGEPANPSNVVKRFSLPARYDVPFSGDVAITASGMAITRQKTENRRGFSSSFSFSTSFNVATPAISVKVKPPSTEGQPKDFSGAIGTKFAYGETIDRSEVATGDVVIVTCKLSFATGYVPPDAFQDVVDRRRNSVAWRRYFVANGEGEIPGGSVSAYDSTGRKYIVLSAKPHALKYVAESEDKPSAVAVDAKGEASSPEDVVVMRFAPDAASAAVGKTLKSSIKGTAPLEEYGRWARIDDGSKAGWVLKEELDK